MFPHFAITEMAAESADLFHNANSFSEMDSSSAWAYMAVMERACRRYISHINHEVSFQFQNPDGSRSRNVVGPELTPDPSKFKRIFKKPRVFGLPEDAFFPSFEYLYERIETPGTARRPGPPSTTVSLRAAMSRQVRSSGTDPKSQADRAPSTSTGTNMLEQDSVRQ